MDDKQYFFGNSVTGRIARSVNWSETSLGHPEQWPDCLKLILGMMYENLQPVCLFWGKDHIYFYNDGYIPIVGAAKHPWAIGRKGSEVWSEIWEYLIPQINQVLKGEGATWNEDQYLPILGDDGKPRDAFFTYSYSPVFSTDGSINGVLVTCTESTARVIAEKKLRESQQSLQLALSAAKMGAWEVNLVTSEVNLSEEAREIFGFSKDYNTTDAAIDDFIFPDDRGSARNALKSAIETREPYDDVYRIVRPSGEIRWVNSKGQARYDMNGNAIMLVGLTFDITEKKISELKTTAALRARDEFLSIASHELKTPLTGLKLQVDFQKRVTSKGKEDYAERFAKFLNDTDQQVNRLSRLVDDMLDVSRIRTGKFTFEWEQIDFCEIVTDVIDRLSDQFEKSGYEIPNIIPCSNAIGRWDRMRLEQIVTNLLTNAIKYGNTKPISVSVEAGPESVTLIVKDQGMGISPEDQRKIFDLFERSVSAYGISGLGLGLYITKQIVQSFHGEISVESKLGEGSTFRVKLPKA